MRKILNKKNILPILLLLFTSAVFTFLLPAKINAACTTHWCCGTVGSGGCVLESGKPGGCSSGEASCSCSGTPMCCDKGDCQTCTPPSCPTHYTTTNTGCSTTSTSCTRYYCIGGSCGTTSRTCYRVKYTVTYDANGGSCTPSSREVCYDSTSSAPSCSRTGYTLTGFTRTSGSGGTLNTSTGEVTNVSGDQTIEAQWESSNTAPSAPTSLLTESQTNPTDITNITPVFSAIYNDSDSGDTSGYYEIEINTASDFSGTSMWDTGKTAMTSTTEGNRSPDFTYNGTTLTYDGTTYYWRIRFWDSYDAQGAWSSVAQFTMDIPTATYYEIEVNTQSDFLGTSMWDTGKTAMTATTAGQRSPEFTYNGNALSGGVTYYWRIRFWDMVDNVSPWSSVSNFEVNRAPTAPTGLETEELTNPVKVSDSTPEFSAIYNDSDTEDSAEYYQIQVETESDFNGTSMWDTGKTAMTSTTEGNRSPLIPYAGSTLSDGTTYYWHIKFWDSNDNASNWSSGAEFTMSGGPTATSLLIDGKTNPINVSGDTPTFSAIYTDPNSDNASNYEIEVNTASDFSGTSMWDTDKTSATITSGQRSSNYTYNGTSLSHDSTIYYVRMRFWDTDDNASDWVTGQFTDNISRLLLDDIRIDDLIFD